MYNSTQRAGRRAKGTEFTPRAAVVVISVKALEGIGRAEQRRAEVVGISVLHSSGTLH